MSITLANIGIAVRDLEAAIAFFTDLGLTVLGRDTVQGEWADTFKLTYLRGPSGIIVMLAKDLTGQRAPE